MAPQVKYLLQGVFRKNPPARVWSDTWDVKKILDLLHAWRKSSVINYTCLTLKTVKKSNPENSQDLGLSHNQEAN